MRKHRAEKREINPDPRYNDYLVAKFTNMFMRRGEKAKGERLIYQAFDQIQEKTGEDGLTVFKKAVDNVKPMLEVRSRRVGGATYQVPIEVNNMRGRTLAYRWIIRAARSRKGQSIVKSLVEELTEAANGRGGARRKRDEVHRMAEANKAFSHFRW